jgi:hypothetical protein
MQANVYFSLFLSSRAFFFSEVCISPIYSLAAVKTTCKAISSIDQAIAPFLLCIRKQTNKKLDL